MERSSYRVFRSKLSEHRKGRMLTAFRICNDSGVCLMSGGGPVTKGWWLFRLVRNLKAGESRGNSEVWGKKYNKVEKEHMWVELFLTAGGLDLGFASLDHQAENGSPAAPYKCCIRGRTGVAPVRLLRPTPGIHRESEILLSPTHHNRNHLNKTEFVVCNKTACEKL